MDTLGTMARWSTAAALVAALAAPAAWAHGGKGMHGPMGLDGGPMMGAPMMEDGARRERMLERMAERLQLKPEQREQMRALAERSAQAMRPLHDEMRQLREEQRKLWQAPQLDEAAIAALRERSLRLHERIVTQREQAMLEMARILTPEQRQRMAQGFGEHRRHGHGHHGPAR